MPKNDGRVELLFFLCHGIFFFLRALGITRTEIFVFKRAFLVDNKCCACVVLHRDRRFTRRTVNARKCVIQGLIMQVRHIAQRVVTPFLVIVINPKNVSIHDGVTAMVEIPYAVACDVQCYISLMSMTRLTTGKRGTSLCMREYGVTLYTMLRGMSSPPITSLSIAS